MRAAPQAAALAAVLALAAAAPARADRFEDSLALAKSNAATPSGREFERRIAERFDEKKLRDALTTCAGSVKEDDAAPFTALLHLSSDGRATEVLLRPPLPIAVCLRWTIRETSFPRPPSPGWWVAVEVSPTRAAGVPPIPTAGVATATVPSTPTPVLAAVAARAEPPAASPTPAAPTRPPLPTATPRVPVETPRTAPPPLPPTPTRAAPPTAVPPAVATPPPEAAPSLAIPADVVDYTAGAEGFHVDGRRPDLAALRRTLAATKARFIGPILAQSDGIAPDDPRLEAYWSLAEELNLPVVLPLGPVDVARDETSVKYRVALGDPLKLENVLLRHPKLTVVVSGAGWPFADAMTGLMWRYPRVYADTGGIAWALARSEFDGYIGRLVGAGLKRQILFSTGASTFARAARALEAIQGCEVLTPEARQLILRGNAESLLGAARPGAPAN